MHKPNKYQEAFNRIKRVVVFNKNYRDYQDDLDYIKELIDKEIPMKPRKINDSWGSGMVGFTCDNCGVVHRAPYGFYQAEVKRCNDCGHKIDWSDEE